FSRDWSSDVCSSDLWLGGDREAIGGEKAGILRAGKPCVLAERDPPSSVLRRAYVLGAYAIRGHSDYLIDELDDGRWRWREPGWEIELPPPAMEAPGRSEERRGGKGGR